MTATRVPREGLHSCLSAPARRAFERTGIMTASDLAQYTEAEILALHGVGPSTLPTLKSQLHAAGLTFRASAAKKPARKS
jgi:hypothetical protein